MIDISLIVVGKLKNKNLLTLAEDYIKRIKPFANLKIIEVEAVSFSEHNHQAAKRLEGERIIRAIEKEEQNPKGAATWLLAERGESFKSSLDFSQYLNKKSPLILVLGGALGFADELYQNYPQISLSPLTFTHELARIVFLEQFYRAALISAGKSYHY